MGLPSSLFPSGLPTTPYKAFRFCSIRATCPVSFPVRRTSSYCALRFGVDSKGWLFGVLYLYGVGGCSTALDDISIVVSLENDLKKEA